MKTLMKITSISGIAALTLTACANEDGSLGEKGREGAIAGAVLGGIVGAIDGGKPKNVITGAVVGASAGAVIGNELDKQERDLRNQMGGSGATITNTGSELIVTLPEAITFETDSTYVRPTLQGHLNSLANNLQQYPNSMVDVIGHTDNVGDAGYNQGLSARRAQSVTGVLVGAGVNPNRIRSYGRGETSPVMSNDTPAGRAANRRVEIIITPSS
ncbi:hypothetical protein BFP76_14115 [Amylibacter kogurei]|uniref:17 kDa surface antigen n=1 Tax=Paramylibacter kogurei TaxID=1889778 RepID=A0A2G5KA92_9RHOB|nr:OmpA family protein [Amylibacter kogurei]PIB26089.1 hypothetical protein BFP76_14115 [Amylibacter kogurei]